VALRGSRVWVHNDVVVRCHAISTGLVILTGPVALIKKTTNLIYCAAAVLDDTSTRLPRETTILVWMAGTKNIKVETLANTRVEIVAKCFCISWMSLLWGSDWNASRCD
jgi:hypothetical protein